MVRKSFLPRNGVHLHIFDVSGLYHWKFCQRLAFWQHYFMQTRNYTWVLWAEVEYPSRMGSNTALRKSIPWIHTCHVARYYATVTHIGCHTSLMAAYRASLLASLMPEADGTSLPAISLNASPSDAQVSDRFSSHRRSKWSDYGPPRNSDVRLTLLWGRFSCQPICPNSMPRRRNGSDGSEWVRRYGGRRSAKNC